MATVERERAHARAEARYVRTAPRKAQLVANEIRGRTVPEARTILAFLTRDAARDVEKVLNSAVANAEANHGLVGDELLVSAAYVGAGPTLKRWRARARGRVARIRKRTCHITIELVHPESEPAPRTAEVRARAEAPAAETAPATGAAPAAPPGNRSRVAETTEPAETAEDKPKTRPKRAQKPKAEAREPEAGEEPKRRRRTKPVTEETPEEAPKQEGGRRRKADD